LLLGDLVVVAVAHRRLGPGSSATTSLAERAVPSSAVQARNTFPLFANCSLYST
jgi:hypothetical protein